MKLVVVAIFLLGLVGAQNTEVPDPFAAEPPMNPIELGTEVITALLNSGLVQNKLQKIYQVVDLKIRFVTLIKDLVTRENLILLRRTLDFVVRLCNFVIGFLPEGETNRESFLDGLLPLLTLEDPENPANIQRINRQAASTEVPVNFTNQDRQLFEKHKDDVVNVAQLIYNTP